jgi:hypothetical protein
MRRRLSYANVAATLALVFSMSGGALAANHYLISSTKQLSPKVLKKLKGATGKAGSTGKEGPAGKEGPTGKEGSQGKEGKAPAIPALTFTALTLENGWTQYSAGYGPPSYTKDAEGYVHLSGALNGTKMTSETVAVLPAGFRPTGAEAVWLRTAATNGSFDPTLVDLYINSAGKINAYPAAGATEEFVSLEGLTFYAG